MKQHRWTTLLALPLAWIGMTTALGAEESQGKVKVVFVDHVAIIVTDRARNDQHFRMADHAKVLIDDREAKLGDLKPGDQVMIVWRQRDGQKLASLITCKKEWVIGSSR